MNRGNFLASICFFGLPLLAVGNIAFHGYALTPPGSSPLIWMLVATLIGCLFVGAMIVSQGNDMTDYAVGSLIVIVLTFVLIPVFQRARTIAQKKAARAARVHRRLLNPKTAKRPIN